MIEVDDALVLIFLRRPATGSAPAFAPRRSRIESRFICEVGADLVHLVDERDARHVVLVGLAPDGLALGGGREGEGRGEGGGGERGRGREEGGGGRGGKGRRKDDEGGKEIIVSWKEDK